MKLTAQQIHRLRAELGMTQSQFAEHVGVTRFSVGAWERGQRKQNDANDCRIRAFVRTRGIRLVQ